jgi:uncharacterized protein
MNLKPILQAVLAEYELPLTGPHGVAHWARVLENGLRLSQESRASVGVVSRFAVLHDSRRINDGFDPEHGPRAGEFAARLRGEFFELSDEDFQRLVWACEGHTRERTHPDVTIQTCWDSDRLDLGRVRVKPDPYYLSTEVAKCPETIRWADGRASFGVVPDLVLNEWGLDLQHTQGWNRGS